MFAKYIRIVAITSSFLVIGQSFKLEPRILNGFSSQDGQFPYFATLAIQINNTLAKICGGTLISKQFILTAAHCITEAEKVAIHLGSTKMQKIDEAGRQVFNVFPRSFHIHQDYYEDFRVNDIALIRLPHSIVFTNTIKAVNLPQNCDVRGFDIIAIGNGETRNNIVAPTLQYAPMTIISRDECEKIYPPTVYSEQMICATSDEARSFCYGDSGGPLIRDEDNALIGVASFIHPIGCEFFPIAFTDLLVFGRWISGITGLKLPNCY